MAKPEPRHGDRAIFIMLAVFIISCWATLRTVEAEKPEVDTPTLYGYTWSLSLFVLPTLVIGAWIHFFAREDRVPRKALWLTILMLAPIGFLLDVVFGLLFFRFENVEATINFPLPGFNWETFTFERKIPLEEFVFYGSGFTFVLVLYVWLDEYFLRLYNVDEYGEHEACRTGIIRFHSRSVWIAAVLTVLAVLFKKLVGPEEYRDHFPGWLTFEILAAFLPAAALYRTARHFVNWRAFSLTCVSTILISIVWEVTLGLPYKWWGFNDDLMLGIFIDAWWGLPIEEPFLWIMVSFTSIIVFETVKVYLHVRDRHGSRPMQTLFG